MVRIVVALLAGLVGAAIVHIAVILAMPHVAGNNAWSRLARLGEPFASVPIDPQRAAAPGDAAAPAGSVRQEFAFVDPAFITASCRFSLADGPVRISAAGRTDFWSASIYSRAGDNLYSINDRSAVGGRFDILVGTAAQMADGAASSTDPNETTIPVEFASQEGYLTLRVLVDEESERPEAEAYARSLSCAPEREE